MTQKTSQNNKTMTNEEIYESGRRRLQLHPADDDGRLLTESARHSGTFRSDNPYLRNLVRSSTKQDEDALFELAVKEEAKIADYERERADKRADLLDQRAYDDPRAVVARNRLAGINSDLEGSVVGSGSGGSVTGNMPSMQTATDNTSHFDNAVDRSQMLFAGLHTASEILSSLSSFGTSVVGSINTLSMLPLQKESVQLSNDIAREDITSKQLSNDSSRLSLINSGVSTIKDLSSFITPEVNEEDATPLMTALGVPPDMIPSLYKAIQHAHKNPKFIADWEQNKADAIAKEEFNKVFTREIQHKSLALASQLEMAEKGLKFAQTDLEYKVANLLNTEDNATYLANKQEKVWDNEMQSAVIEGDALDLKAEEVKRNLSAFRSQLEMVDNGIKQSQSFIDEIFAEAKSRKVIPSGARMIDGVYLSAEEASFVEIERQKILGYNSLGASFLNNANSFMIDTFMRHYFQQQLMHPSGEIRPLYNKMHPDVTSFIGSMFTFDQITSGSATPGDVVDSYSGIILDLLRLFK